jgi:hypothetical protein
MTHSTGRRVVAILGALLFWAGVTMTVLFVAAAIWLLVDGTQPAWIILAVTVALTAVGAGIVRWSRVPFGEALNIGL